MMTLREYLTLLIACGIKEKRYRAVLAALIQDHDTVMQKLFLAFKAPRPTNVDDWKRTRSATDLRRAIDAIDNLYRDI